MKDTILEVTIKLLAGRDYATRPHEGFPLLKEFEQIAELCNLTLEEFMLKYVETCKEEKCYFIIPETPRTTRTITSGMLYRTYGLIDISLTPPWVMVVEGIGVRVQTLGLNKQRLFGS